MNTLGTDGMECTTCGQVIAWVDLDTHTHDSIEEALAEIEEIRKNYSPVASTASYDRAMRRFDNFRKATA